jgi:competence protein ComEA
VAVVRARLAALAAGTRGPEPDDPDPAAQSLPTVVRPGPLRPVVVALASAAVAAWLVVRVVSGPTPAPVELAPGTPLATVAAGTSASPLPTSSAAVPGAGASTGSPAQLVVHVIGDVRRPGLVRLAPGSRVADALAAAGGLVRGGGSGALNLARLVVDGEQIVVSPDTPAAAIGPTAAPGEAVVDLNTATEAELDTLPGVGPVMAARILEWRSAHGRFASVEQLREISGIGARTYERLAPRVRV